MSRYKNKKSFFIILILVMTLVLFITLLCTNISFIFKKSIHSDAKRYSTKHCLVFYPNNSYAKKYAKDLTKKYKDDRVLDYSLIPFGDYYLLSYTSDDAYFVDKEYNLFEIKQISDEGKRIIADYLRYQIKIDKPELYYSTDFMNKSKVNNIDFSNLTYEIDASNLIVNFIDYDLKVNIPLKYIEIITGLNFNYGDIKYRKPIYIDNSDKHPIVCITFDNGPDFYHKKDEANSIKIVDILYSYDANATFFIDKDNLTNSDYFTDLEIEEFINNSIKNGNDYGLNTANNNYLTSEDINNAVKELKDYFLDNFDYKMNLFRPFEVDINADTLAKIDIPAIMWNVDSYDWDYTDPIDIYNRLNEIEMNDGDIIVMHDVYLESYEALEKILPSYIEKGYQLLSVSEMLKALDIDINSLSYYYNFNPPYFE